MFDAVVVERSPTMPQRMISAYRSRGSRFFEPGREAVWDSPVTQRTPLAHLGKICRKVNVRLHRGQMIRTTGRRPPLIRARFGSKPHSLFEARIRPTVPESPDSARDPLHAG